jgi:hypothetical protein
MLPGYKVVLECESVKGFCPFYKKGDRVTFVEPGIVMGETDAICFGGMLTFAPFYRPLIRGIKPEELGLTDRIVTCHAPPLNRPETHATVFFKIKQIPVDETIEDKWIKDLERKGIRGDPEVINRRFWPKDPDKP